MAEHLQSKLLHFFTDGASIHEDFARARDLRVRKLRLVVRVCFYAHCVALAVCIILSAVLHAGAGIIAVALCSAVLSALAFLAVGDMMIIKLLLCAGDAVFAVSMFITGSLAKNGAPFFAVGAVSVLVTILAVVSLLTAKCKIFLDEFPPQAIRREHYTLLPNLLSTIQKAEEEPAPKPVKKTEMQELSDKLKEILCGEGERSYKR